MEYKERVELEHSMMLMWHEFWKSAITSAFGSDLKEKINIRNKETEDTLLDMFNKIYNNKVPVRQGEEKLIYKAIVTFQRKMDELHERYMSIDVNVRELAEVTEEFFDKVYKLLDANVTNTRIEENQKIVIPKEKVTKIF